MQTFAFTASLLTSMSIVFLLSAAEASPPSQVDPNRITFIDAEDLLAERFKISRKPRQKVDGACRAGQRGGGRGMQAKRYCTYEAKFTNIKIEKVISLEIGEMRPDPIPDTQDRARIGIDNYWADAFPFSENATHKTKQYVQTVLTERITNVEKYSTKINIEPKIFDSVGIKLEGEASHSITVELTDQVTKSFENEITMVKPVSFSVPPCVGRWAYFSDSKTRVAIPVKITGLLTADIVDVVSSTKYEIPVRTISRSDDPKLRTFTLSGIIQMQGTDRSLKIELTEYDLPREKCPRARQATQPVQSPK